LSLEAKVIWSMFMAFLAVCGPKLGSGRAGELPPPSFVSTVQLWHHRNNFASSWLLCSINRHLGGRPGREKRQKQPIARNDELLAGVTGPCGPTETLIKVFRDIAVKFLLSLQGNQTFLQQDMPWPWRLLSIAGPCLCLMNQRRNVEKLQRRLPGCWRMFDGSRSHFRSRAN
jgi:hypothetical protein